MPGPTNPAPLSDSAPPAWPMYGQNAQRTGAAATAVIASGYASGFASAALPQTTSGVIAIDSAGNSYVTDTANEGNIYRFSRAGQLDWTYSTGQNIRAAGLCMGSDGTLYVAGTSLCGLTLTAGAATPKFTWPLEAGLVCTGPLALSPDGTTIYLVVTSNATLPASSVIALTLPTDSGGQPVQAWITALAVGGVPMTASTGVAVAPNGMLYVGDTAGHLYGLTATGALTLLATYTNPLTTPAIGADGTVHTLSIDPQGVTTALNAFVPATPGTGYQFSPPRTGLLATNPAAAPTIAGDGSIYLGLDKLYKLSWNPAVLGGYRQVWVGNVTNDHGTCPGPAVIDSSGAVACCGTDNWLVSYSAAGQLLWNRQLTAAGATPSLDLAGAVFYLDGATLCTTAPGGSAALAAVYAALVAQRTPAAGGVYNYPLNATTFADPLLLALVTGAIGSGTLIVVGSLTYSGNSLTLTGTGPWFSATGATLTLAFTSDAAVVALATTATFGATFNLAQAFTALTPSFWARLNLASAQIQQTASTAEAATNWAVTATVVLTAPLAQVAALLISPPASASASGTVALDSTGQPIVTLTVSGALQMTLGGSWSLPVTLALYAGYDTTQQALVSSIQVGASVTLNGQQVTIAANVPETASTILFWASFSPALTVGSVAQMIFWSGGSATGLSGALPPDVANQSSFGLSRIQMTVAPSTRRLMSVTVLFTAGDYTVFSAGSPGVTITLTNTRLFATVVNPLSATPSYQVGVGGTVNINETCPIDIEVTGPDWVISGQAAPGATISPAAAITSLGGSVSLPAAAPTGAFGIISFRASPANGTYFVQFLSQQTWTLFSVGNFTVTVSNFALSVNRVIANPSTVPPTGLIAVQVCGQISLAGADFEVAAYIPDTGDWAFSANLANPIGLPTIGDLADALSSGLSAGLPPAIANLGSGIVMRQLDLSLTGTAGGTNVVAVGIGSAPGWSGWTIFSSPFTFALTDALVQITLRSSDTALTALVQATFAFGTTAGSPGLRVQLPLPFTSGNIVISLVPGPNGLAVPTVGQLVGLVSSSWAAALPAAISGLGSNISVSRFDVTVVTATATTTTVTFRLGAVDPAAVWSPLGLSGFGLSNLGVGGTIINVSSPPSTTPTGSITAALHIGTNGFIPLIASMTGNLSTWVIQLDPSQSAATLPTVGDIIGLFSQAWAATLPSQITSLGQSMVLQTFTLTKGSSANTVAVAIGTGSDWGPFQPVPGFSGLSLTGYNLALNYNSVASPAFTGSLNLTGTLFSQPANVSATMPNLTFTATLTLNSFNMQTLCQQFLGDSATAPSWLSNIGVEQIILTVSFTSPTALTIAAVIASHIDLPVAGSLDNVSVTAKFGGGRAASVCLTATWNPPAGPAIPGEICYPFNSFSSDLAPEDPVDDFPKSRPSNPNPPNPTSVGGVSTLITACGYTAAGLATAFTLASYNNSDDDKTCAAGAISNAGDNPTAAQLALIVAGLAQSFPDSPTQVAEALVGGATFQGLTLSRDQVAAALAQGLPAPIPTASVVAQAICAIISWGTTTPALLTACLNAAGFTPEQVGPILPFLFPSGPNACVTAAAVLAALHVGYPAAVAADLMNALADTGFTAGECVRLFIASVTTAAPMAALLAGASFSPLSSAQALYTSYPGLTAGGVGTAALMTTVMAQAFAALAANPAGMWPVLETVGYPAAPTLAAMKSQYSAAFVTAQSLATAAVAAGYSPVQISAELLALYQSASWGSATDLATVLLVAAPTLTGAGTMSALLAAAEPASAAATAFIALAPTHWASTNTAQGLANALATGGYGATAVLTVEQANFPVSVATALVACQLLHDTTVFIRTQAQVALLASGFTAASVNAALTTVYGP